MLIIPAIDLKDGKVVRLVQGKYEEITMYSEDPVARAKMWEEQGAQLIHIVDLDGALTGKLQNLYAVKNILRKIKIPVELGGGIRTKAAIQAVLDIGVSRVVLGTAACENFNQIIEWLKEFKEKLIISIDAKYGKVAKQGWTQVTEKKAVDLVRNLVNNGIKTLIYTDISRDGTLAGPRLGDIQGIITIAGDTQIIVSGGISSLEHIAMLNKLQPKSPAGVIIGKALYENKFKLIDAIQTCWLNE